MRMMVGGVANARAENGPWVLRPMSGLTAICVRSVGSKARSGSASSLRVKLDAHDCGSLARAAIRKGRLKAVCPSISNAGSIPSAGPRFQVLTWRGPRPAEEGLHPGTGECISRAVVRVARFCWMKVPAVNCSLRWAKRSLGGEQISGTTTTTTLRFIARCSTLPPRPTARSWEPFRTGGRHRPTEASE